MSDDQLRWCLTHNDKECVHIGRGLPPHCQSYDAPFKQWPHCRRCRLIEKQPKPVGSGEES